MTKRSFNFKNIQEINHHGNSGTVKQKRVEIRHGGRVWPGGPLSALDRMVRPQPG